MWLYYIKINKNGTPKDIQLTLRKAGKKKGKQKTNRTSKKWKIKIGRSKLSDHELLIAKFRLKLKKVEKNTRPFRYDLSQIPYIYTLEVTNRYKGLDLIECLKNYGCRFLTLYRRQWSRPSPRKRNAKRQNVCLRIPYK